MSIEQQKHLVVSDLISLYVNCDIWGLSYKPSNALFFVFMKKKTSYFD